MASKGTFGTFGGVFTPSILTILGVIMYLRLPWVVGNAGLYMGLGIVAVAHIISVCTGLSISSIATDKKVGAGGDYYIVSRSLGLPIGGTLGIAQFLGLAFSVSLYVIGFSESVVQVLGFEVTPNSIRICGSITLLLVTIVTLISTALAIKTQYIIMALIAASLVSIFFGSHPAPPETAQLTPPEGGASFAVLFGIFFPAVTGFTAGVSMSGDLRDPKKSIPRGTMAAILVGLVVYIALAWLLAAKIPTKELIDNPKALLEFSAFPLVVTAGLWGATLSSALGSILGAPRVLQAVASDRIAPRWFARGHGPTNEPRNALLLSFVLAEAGVLIAELDAIARIVSMVFLTSYAFLNASCAIERWVSPDFRPSFRIPPMVSIVGAVTCVLVMIQLDLVAMLGAVAFMVGLFLVLSRRQLTLDAGDAWEGVWSALVRSGLWRLSREQRQQRNWRPNVLLFRLAESKRPSELREFASSLISGNGILSELLLSDASGPEVDTQKKEHEELTVGMFAQQIPTRDAYQSISDICRYRGFAGLEPNTVLIEWSTHASDPERFGELLDELTQLDHNLLLYSPNERTGETEGRERIDVWWSPGAGNAPLSLALVRFITGAPEYTDASVRFLIDNYDVSSNDQLRATLRGLLTGARVEAEIRVINRPPRGPTFEEKVASESADALLTVMALPLDPDQCSAEYLSTVDELVGSLHRVLIARGSSAFEPVLSVSRPASISFLPPTSDGRVSLPVIEVPQTPGVGDAVSKLAGNYQLLAASVFKNCVERLYGQQLKLLRDLKKATASQFEGLDDALNDANPRRQRRYVNRIQSSILMRQRELLTAFADKSLGQQRSVLEGRIESFLDDDTVVDPPPYEVITVEREREDLEPKEGDSAEVERIKARMQRFRWLRRGRVRYKVPVSRLKAYYFEQALKLMLANAVRRFVTDSHRLFVQLGKQLGSYNLLLTVLEQGDDSEQSGGLAEALREHEAAMIGHLAQMIDSQKEELAKHQWELLSASRQLVQEFADDVDRLDVPQVVARERRFDAKQARATRTELSELPSLWFDNQSLVLGRARLALDLWEFQHRLSSSVHRERASMLARIRGGTLAECVKLHKALDQLKERLDADAADQAPELSVRLDWTQRFDAEDAVETLMRGITDLATELPQWVTTLTDESIQLLEEGGDEGVDTAEVPVFRIAQFLVEARLLAGVQASLEEIPRLEQRAAAVSQDVMRLVSFQLNELAVPEDGVDAPLPAQVKPAVVNGLERVQTEIDALSEALEGVDGAFEKQLAVVVDGTNAYDLTRSATELEQHIRRHRGERAVSGARHVLRLSSDTVKDAVAHLLYRRSAGQLMAQRLRERSSHRGKVVDHVLSLVEQHMPRDEVMGKLPAYYRQLFVGKATVNETFWVGRSEELAEAKRALKSVNRGTRGAIVITGERSSGKTSLLQRIVSEQLGGSQLVRLYAPRGGSIALADFESELCKAAGIAGTIDEVLEQLPDDATVVLDDLELWWERSPDGRAVIDAVLGLIERHGGRILFLLSLSTQAYSFVNRLCHLEDSALAVINCAPLPAVELEKIITLRHTSTGLKYELEGKSEDELATWHLAALFSRHFDFSRGWIGAALRSWITHVRKVSSSTLVVDAPSIRPWDVLDELRGELTALLLQLVIHKQLDRTRLARISGVESSALKSDVETLVRMGLLVESQQGMLTINPFVHHAVVERLARRGLLV